MCEDLPISIDDIYQAYEDCRRKKKNKRGTVKFEKNALFNCIRIVEDINNRKYELKPSECFIVERPRVREVFCASFSDRVVQHFVYNELSPVIEKMLIRDTCSCRLRKGTDYAIKRVKRKTRQISENYTKDYWILKIDLSGFFMSIDRDWLCDLVQNVIDTRYKGCHKSVLKYLVDIIIRTDVTKNAIRLDPITKWNKLPPEKSLFCLKTGLAIGNITSQLFANFALNNVDHYIKSRHVGYVRYVDDMYLADLSKEKLIETRNNVAELLSKQNMRINKKKTIIQRGEYGISFLGVIVKPYYSVLGEQRVRGMYRSSKTFTDPYKAFTSASTRKGMFERYKGYRIAKRWYLSFDEDIRKMVKFDGRCKFIWTGKRPSKDKIINLEDCMSYKLIKSDKTEINVSDPNWIKMNPRYPSFICCGSDDAECVLVQEGDETVCYNVNISRYPEYETVEVLKEA